jgi:hypothetical protein
MRYFFISYFYKTPDGFGYGNSCMSSDTFPSLDTIELNIRQNLECEGISVMSIRELNEEDYNSFLGK